VALAFAVVRDPGGRVLLARRIDTGNWELPGGAIEPGETATGATVREVLEETGVAIAVSGLAGVFCDPAHVIVYPESGQASQQHVTLLHAVPAPGTVP
jgi:8-oxo-dGTP pyrophosphatase MutT (NUDIX family)